MKQGQNIFLTEFLKQIHRATCEDNKVISKMKRYFSRQRSLGIFLFGNAFVSKRVNFNKSQKFSSVATILYHISINTIESHTITIVKQETLLFLKLFQTIDK